MGATRTAVWRAGRYELRRDLRRLLIDGEPARLGARAFDLLVALVDRPGRVTTKDELLHAVWPEVVVEENTLQVHMSALRRVLGADAIRTVPGRGYQLALAADTDGAPDDEATAAAPVGARTSAQVVRLAPSVLPNSLPHDLPRLIGRDPDLAAVRRLLAEHRVVTITGPGGAGKTRLALAAAAEPPDGIGEPWRQVGVTELAGVAEGVPVAESVARSLGITLPGLQAAAVELVDVLRPRELLLVLDNCEHRLQEAGALVEALARQTPRVRVLATSQQTLGCRSEQVFRLGMLAVPAEGTQTDEAAAFGSVALLVDRVRSRDPGFAVDDGNIADAVAICRRLDGLPLAIELAAARVPVLGLSGLRVRLQEHLRVLGTSPRQGLDERPERQRTLRSAIAWSHELLDADERRIFRRLGVFAGSFSFATAEAVAADPADGELDTLDRLQALVDKSLVLSLGGGADRTGGRLRLLDSTRAFALEQLHAADEHTMVMQRLCAALLPVFELSAAQRREHAGGAVARSREADIDNLRAALDWMATQEAMATRHVELAGAAAWVWPRLGLRLEGLRRCRDALARVDAATPAGLEARLQLGYVRQLHRRATLEDCVAAERAARLYAQLDDRLERFHAFSFLAHVRALRGEEALAMEALEAMAEAFDPGSPVHLWGVYTFTSGHALAQFGRLDEAMDLAERAARLTQVHEDSLPGRAILGVGLGQMHAQFGRFDDALTAAQDGLVAARRLGSSGRVGMLLGDISVYLAELGRLDEAVAHAREAIDVRSRDGTLWLQLDQLAYLACTRGLLHEAALALGRAEVHNRWRHGRREAAIRRPFEQATRAVTAAFAAAELASLFACGAAMGDDEVARLSLDPATGGAWRRASPPFGPWGPAPAATP